MKIKKPHYEFSADKNQQLIEQCHISFEGIIAALSRGKLLDTIEHYNKSKYPNQEIYLGISKKILKNTFMS